MTNIEIWLLGPLAACSSHGSLACGGAAAWCRRRTGRRTSGSTESSPPIAALAAAATAAYVAMRVPWIDDFTGLLGRPPIVHGKPTLSQPTRACLFGTPLRIALAAIVLTDPVSLRILTFRGPRAHMLRLLPLIALAIGAYSISGSIGALAAAVAPAN